ncbi:MAG: spermidine/putrescine ABC transporter substrate-binding protein [Candidatus Eisenbacteria bacterium]
MKHAITRGLMLLALLGLVSGCAKREAPTLHVYTWADYIKPELVARFEKEHTCRIVIDTFDSNESMYAKLKAGAAGYDLVTPSSYQVAIMAQQGMLLDLDHAKLPNLVHVDREYLAVAIDSGMVHSVPYMLTNSGIAYLKSKVQDPQPTWAMFERTDLKGRMTMLNDMRETIGAALKYLGYSLNTTDSSQLEQAKVVVIRWKHQLAKFENEQYKSGLASGEFLVSHGYSGDILQARAENPDIVFLAPREGLSIACDDLVILKDSKQAALAYQFIDFLHTPEIAAENSQFISYLCPNSDSYPLLPAEFLNDPAVRLAPEVRAKCEVIRDLGADNAKYTRVWDLIKAAP